MATSLMPLGELREIEDEITGKGASVVFINGQQAYSRYTEDAIGQLMLNLLTFAAFERTLIRDWQREGIRLAQAAGNYKAAHRSSPLNRWRTHAA